MKQITLETQNTFVPWSFCSGRLLACWGFYGLGMWLLSVLLGPSLWGQFAAWVIALALSVRMLACTADF
jgi:hypothetical protein